MFARPYELLYEGEGGLSDFVAFAEIVQAAGTYTHLLFTCIILLTKSSRASNSIHRTQHEIRKSHADYSMSSYSQYVRTFSIPGELNVKHQV